MISKKVRVRQIRFSNNNERISNGYMFKIPERGRPFIVYQHPFGEEILLSTDCIDDVLQTRDTYYVDTKHFRYTITKQN